jgi:acyl dehydratase
MTTIDSEVAEYAELLRERIGDQFVNEWGNDLLGPDFPRPLVQGYLQLTRDTIRLIANARGDLNPLFRDEEYAKSSKFGTIIAPPTCLYAVVYNSYTSPFSNRFSGTDGGDESVWFAPIPADEKIRLVTTSPTKIEIKDTASFGKVIFRTGRHDFYRSGNVLIGRRRFWGALRHVESVARFMEGRGPQQVPTYTDDYIKSVYTAQDAEQILGNRTRYWEDVNVGDALTPVVRGPHTAMESVAWTIAAIGQNFWVSDRLFRYIHEYSNWGIWDDRLRVWRNDHDPFFEYGRHGGYGSQRSSWMEMLLTNWMGDEGFLWRLRTEHRLYGGYGWVYWCRAVVAKKSVERRHHCVTIEGRIENQNGDEVDRVRAVVLLPSREAGSVDYPAPSETELEDLE